MSENLEREDAAQSDLESTSQNAFDEDIDEQVSRMMGEGGVAPPVQPRSWNNWKRTKNQLQSDNTSESMDERLD